MPENIDEAEYRKRIEEERAKMSAESGKEKKKPAGKTKKAKQFAPRAVTSDDSEEPKTEEIAEPEEVEAEEAAEPEEAKAEKVADPEEVKAEVMDDKAAQKIIKKETTDAKKAQEKLTKELISKYDKRVANYIKTRADRDAYWTDKDWYKREFWDRKDIQKRQKKLYKKQIQYMWKNSAYMRVRLEGEGILKSGAVKNIADIARVPFITSADLAMSQREAPPYGYIYSAKPEEISNIGISNEMSESPRYFFTSKKDLPNAYRLARPLMAAGINSSDTVVVLGMDDFWGLPLICEMLKQDIGCMVLCVAPINAKRKMQVIREIKATVLVGAPSQVQALADAAGMVGMDAAQTDVRVIISGGEAGIGSSAEIGKAMEQAWNAKVYEFYGCQDVGILAWSCDTSEGLHLMEDDYVFEILDPDTKQPVADGADGELVVTPLLNHTVPVTRYRTRDIVSVIADPCPCCRTMTRIVIKRKLAAEPVLPEPEPPEEGVVDPEPEPVAVAAGISEVEAEAAAEDIGGEEGSGYEEPGEPKEPAEPEEPAEPVEPEEPDEPGEPEKVD